MKIFENIKLSVNKQEKDLVKKLSRDFNINPEEIVSYKIIKKSIDARKGIQFVYRLAVELKGEALKKHAKLSDYHPEELEIPLTSNKKNICVIGFGPSSMFAALILSKAGHNVTIFEKGDSVDNRVSKVDKFFKEHVLDVSTNVQFGEGGAGTFSDGKLNTRSKSPYNNFVLDTFIKYGANETISYISNPHIGTDVLRKVVKNFREDLIKNGVKINFLSEVTDMTINNNMIESITVNNQNHSFDEYILGIGNSARSTFELLYKKGINMESKQIAVGYRVEHLQENININQFKEHFSNPSLGSAEYKLTNGNCYSFCMCPGGYVVNASSEEGHLVTNGMSNYARDNVNANSAIIVQIDKTEHPLGLINFQREIEKKCFELSGGYNLPVMNIKDFVNKKTTQNLVLKPSATSGYCIKDLKGIYSEEINNEIRNALKYFDKKLPGFLNGIIVGVETRSSSPVRIIRDEFFRSNIINLYPIGEGAGYAGGITSSAMDGVKVALSIK